jgi:hypothetical protein
VQPDGEYAGEFNETLRYVSVNTGDSRLFVHEQRASAVEEIEAIAAKLKKNSAGLVDEIQTCENIHKS